MLFKAQKTDLPDILQLCYTAYLEYAKEDLGEVLKPHTPTIAQTIDYCYKYGVVWVVKDEKNAVRGVCLAEKTNTWWTDEGLLNVLFCYVQPSFRSKRAGIVILKELKRLSEVSNLPLRFEIFTNKDRSRKEKLLKRLGFKEQASTFTYKVG